ncbi:MAG: radical SAM protein [Chitinivibrionales bacterium]|nr:radical SAM protein [Chitinivibrionales bacterium]MBD3357001.1 radical SAM protein [Chitinivibrionales bacterium]
MIRHLINRYRPNLPRALGRFGSQNATNCILVLPLLHPSLGVQMIIEKSKEMMRESFQKSTYRFAHTPPKRFGTDFGIYIHVPFCRSKCAFCPFYKEIYQEAEKKRYLKALTNEINRAEMTGQCSWLYFGGGTPNLLTIDELASILETIRSHVDPKSIGIELLPSIATQEYLCGLANVGFTKISMGVESFQEKTLVANGRKPVPPRHVENLLTKCGELGLWSNVDMMIGIREQAGSTFLPDIESLTTMAPSQVTLYPHMTIRNAADSSSMSNAEQFSFIEKAGEILVRAGYKRKGVWTFGKGDDIYDSSRDELVADYAGFGPTAFSTYGDWKVVNPELDVYCDMHSDKDGRPLGFIGKKTKAADNWRRFARMIYDLESHVSPSFPLGISGFCALLGLTGYAARGKLTGKGILFAHEITKTVVESLPFPIQNPRVVENYNDYLACKGNTGTAHARAAAE